MPCSAINIDDKDSHAFGAPCSSRVMVRVGRTDNNQCLSADPRLKTSLHRNDGDALVGNVNSHALPHGEASLLQPIAAQA
jgi:hypothetical protein